ncbi:MAG: hypothetical protein PHW87_04140 [Methanothrix sp.]|nr:hypothetical protein [Methanothrix sp.]
MMAIEVPTKNDLPMEVLSEASTDPSKALHSFRPVQNNLLLIVTKYLPTILLLGAAVDILKYGTVHIMYISWIMAVAVSIKIFHILIEKIPKTLSILWERQILVSLDDTRFRSEVEEVAQGPTSVEPRASDLDVEYTRFVQEYESLLNHPVYQWIFGFMFLLLLFFARPVYEFSNWLHPEFGPELIFRAGGAYALLEGLIIYLNEYVITNFSRENLPGFLSGLTIEPFFGLIIGLIAWRMLITGIEIKNLGKRFNFRPQIMHPDSCGGLEPLGDLCFYNAMIISVWGIFLGGWIILGPLISEDSFYTPLFKNLLPLPMAAAMICFFLPLWDIHEVMATRKTQTQRHLSHLEKSIDRLVQDALDHEHFRSPEQMISLANGIEQMQQFYQKYEKFPVWPFNKEMITLLITSQVVQILSLIGLGASIANNLRGVMALLGQT